MYHGPRDQVVPFFEQLGFQIPERKGVADFIQEICSEKDQEVPFLCWHHPSTLLAVPDVVERVCTLQRVEEGEVGRGGGGGGRSREGCLHL